MPPPVALQATSFWANLSHYLEYGHRHNQTPLQPLENFAEARQQREEQGRQHQRKYQGKYANERVEPH